MSKLEELTVKYAELTGKAIGAAAGLVDEYEKHQKAAAERIPSAVARLVQVGLIDASDEKIASVQLGQHSESLDVLQRVIDHYEKQAGELRAKLASANLGTADSSDGQRRTVKESAYCDRRRGSSDGPSNADLALARGLGVTLPTA